jgi:N-sulfoglucosamine sulfohydrolase
MKQFALGTGALMLCSAAIAQNVKESQQPNILLFLADDCTYRDLGCYGSTDVITPTIDNFAKEGMQFSRCFQATAMSSPTRSNLYTGIYPVKSGAYPNHTFAKEGTNSIVQYLAPKGYKTGLLGKTHINPRSVFPFEYLGDKADELDFSKMDEFLSKSSTDKKPFCLYVCSHQPHGPYTKGDPSKYDQSMVKLPPYLVDTKETRAEFVKYLAEINYLDGEFAQALELLKKHGFSDNTIVIFASEQGNSFPFSKWTCYGTGLQSAFLARWPGKIKPATKSDAMIEYVDVVPTFMEIAGLKPPEVLDGKSFLPVLLGKETTHKQFVYGIQTTRGIIEGSDYYGVRTVRSEKYRYILNITPEATFSNGTINGATFQSWVKKGKTDPKAKELANKYQHRPAEELYDVVNDPFEMNNLAKNPKFAKERKELKEKLETWMKSQGDKGQQTELEANEHLSKNLKNK